MSEIHGASGGRDERGLVTHVVPYLAATFAEVFTVGSAEYGNLSATSRTWQADQAGAYRVEVTYEGTDNTDSELLNKPTYSAQASYQEQALESHPQIEELIEKYNGRRDDVGNVTFPATLVGTSGTNGLEGESGISAEKRNPLAGLQKYMFVQLVWTKKSVSRTLPSGIFRMMGKIISNPPGPAPKIPNRNSWLVMPPEVVQRGKLWEITEQFSLQEEGAPVAVYNLGISSGSGTTAAKYDSLGSGGVGLG